MKIRIHHLIQRLDILSLGNEEEWNTLSEEMEQALNELRTLAASPESSEEGATRGIASAVTHRFTLAPPTFTVPTEEKKEAQARFQLKAFSYATHAIAVIFLAGAGFSEIYLANPIFGATPWRDYFALLVWGFGAEASRASIADMVKNWGVNAS